MRLISKISILLTTLLLAACGHWGAEKYEALTQEHVDSQLSIGMSFDAFEQRFPMAKMLEGEVGDGAFLVVVNKACFRCTNSDTFKRSMDSYARVVRFSDAKLTAIEAVSGGGAR